jgi:hypothetical protein
MNNFSSAGFALTPANIATFQTTLDNHLADLQTALTAHPTFNNATISANIASLRTDLPGVTTLLSNSVTERDNFFDTIQGVANIAELNTLITSANTQISNLNTAINRISDVTNFTQRIENQLDWAIRNAQSIEYAILDRIDELERQPQFGVNIDDYRAFLALLQEEIENMQEVADGLEFPPTLSNYSTAAEFRSFIDTYLREAVNGMGGGFRESLESIATAAGPATPTTPPDPNVLLPAGRAIIEGRTSNFKGIPFYMNQLNHLIRTFARAMNEGRNTNDENIPGSIGHLFGFDANGQNTSALFFTFEDPITGRPGVIDDEDPFRSLRMWVLADPVTGEPLRDPNNNNRFVTVLDPNPPANVARDDMGRPMFTLDYSQFNALNFIVNPDLITDPSLLAASSNHNIGQANNDVVHGFLAVGNDKSLFREGRLIDFIIATSNHLAVDNNQARMFRESYTEVTMQTHNHRLSVKSVDTEEEMLNLVRFQNMFTATSRLINVLDTVYDTLINRLGNF